MTTIAASDLVLATDADIRAKVRQSPHHLIQAVVSALWGWVLEHAAARHAARHEEKLFLDHLACSAHWHRIEAATNAHRQRQGDFDAQQAQVKQLSAGIFRRSLERFWQQLSVTADCEEEYATPPWEIRNGQCVVKGTNEAYDRHAGGPQSKYEALFDSRPVFDGLRVSFLRLAGGPRLVRLE